MPSRTASRVASTDPAANADGHRKEPRASLELNAVSLVAGWRVRASVITGWFLGGGCGGADA
ncbi:hypothetical protein Psuf_021640 [Phytohabitans suffuscus]|uniref:Uncharacterized protein n=1 Tax=Phytohabitans suffuscus TaxID=624315 RepID=A0A6F8YFY0_9ACTN|nr:hypothetical protein Psuf_021640 [Phytohabitans suffuscus]